MAYNQNIHHRRSIRLKGYDYSQAGLYFITICCEDRMCRFGKIENGEMILNEFGNIAYNDWMKLSERFSNFELDVFQIMPNHIHGIIILKDAKIAIGQPQGIAPTIAQMIEPTIDQTIDTTIEPTNGTTIEPTIGTTIEPTIGTTIEPTIADIIGAYKSLAANGCLGIFKQRAGVNPAPTMGKLWQRNYYEHIIRDEQSYQTISKYILNNPAKWADDKFYNQ